MLKQRENQIPFLVKKPDQECQGHSNIAYTFRELGSELSLSAWSSFWSYTQFLASPAWLTSPAAAAWEPYQNFLRQLPSLRDLKFYSALKRL